MKLTKKINKSASWASISKIKCNIKLTMGHIDGKINKSASWASIPTKESIIQQTLGEIVEKNK